MEPDNHLERFASFLNGKRYAEIIRPLLEGNFKRYEEALSRIPQRDIFEVLTKPTHAQGNKPLHILARLGNSLAFAMTVARLTDRENCHKALKKRNSEGLSPLHIAAEKGDVHTVKALIDGVPDRDLMFELLKQTTRKEGLTALQLASKNGHLKLIEYILTSPYFTSQQSNELLHPLNNKNKKPEDLTTNNEVKRIFEDCERIIRGSYSILAPLAIDLNRIDS